MTQNPNQRLQNTEQGQMDLQINPAVLAGQIAAAESDDLVPGSPLKLSDIVGAVPQFLLATADDDNIFGYLVRNIKDQTVSARGYAEVAFTGSVMYMTAGAAIARGAKVETDVSEVEVITVSSNPVTGIALDKAAASGDLIRVLILAPGSSGAGAFTTISASGAVTFDAALTVAGLSNLDGGIAVDTDKFTVSAAGVVSIASTLGVTGISTLVGLLNANGGIAVDTDKFTVSAAGVVVVDSTLTVGGNIIANGLILPDVLDYSAGAGVIPITHAIVALTTGGAEALSIVDGVDGQEIEIIMVSDGGDGTLTPDSLANGSTLTFDGFDSAKLRFVNSAWHLVGTPTATLA